MKTPMLKLSTVAVALFTALGLTSLPTLADGFAAVADAVKKSKTSLDLRYRYEQVSQDGIGEDANASTLRTRLSWQSGKLGKFSVKLEIDDVTAIGDDDYNSTSNGNTTFPVVADPEGTDINQAYIQYSDDALTLTAGRQRIVHNDQRFVGGVAWRQNEQTFDGYRIEYKANKIFALDYSYVYNVNRIFGPTGVGADLGGNIHLFNGSYAISDDHKLAFFVYGLDFDSAPGASSNTFGTRYEGKFSALNVVASYANQNDAGDNPNDFSADYMNFEINGKMQNFTLAAGYELLGADNGVGFSTPLATLHKFQGFADKFLNTRSDGIEDIYIKIGTKFGDLALSATWHNFKSDVGSLDFGDELDLIAAYKMNPNFSALLKYATYDADSHASDTDKLWFMLNAKF